MYNDIVICEPTVFAVGKHYQTFVPFAAEVVMWIVEIADGQVQMGEISFIVAEEKE